MCECSVSEEEDTYLHTRRVCECSVSEEEDTYLHTRRVCECSEARLLLSLLVILALLFFIIFYHHKDTDIVGASPTHRSLLSAVWTYMCC